MFSNVRSILRVFVVALACAFLLTSCPGKLDVDDPEEYDPITWDTCSYSEGDHPCDFVLKDQNDQPWRLYDHYGSIIVIDFSTEWCGYCQVAARVLEGIANDYLGADVVFVTVLVEDGYGAPASLELTSRWAEYFGLSLPVLAGDRSMIDTYGQDGWAVSAWPTFFFVDKEMVLHGNIRGWSEIAIRDYLDRMIAAESEETGE